MNRFVDDLLVGLLLVVGFGYATFALGPKAFRKRCVRAIAGVLALAPALRGIAARVAGADAQNHGSCGGCDSCGSAAPHAPPEVRVAVSKIRRRDETSLL